MQKTILTLLVLFLTNSVTADILLPKHEEDRLKRQYEQGLARCPKDKPLYDGEKCHSCDELINVNIAGFMKCSEICPNRRSAYECGSACILKNPPSNKYTHINCHGWIEKCQLGSFQNKMDGKCYTCRDFDSWKDLFDAGGLVITKAECLSCSNAQFIDGVCYPKCPKDKPLLVDGRCQSCDLTERSGYVVSGCSNCPNRFTLRYEGSVGCYQKCPKSKPLLGLDTGECFACNEEQFDEKFNWQPQDRTVLGCSKCSNKISHVKCVGMKASK